MSLKGAHVQDSCVLERRLRPIYDWLDVGNYKKAIQECDKVLKKSANLDLARALKALSLLRMGKEAECLTILDSLTALTPSDDAILQAMTMCYRELQQLSKVTKLYEAAVKVDPTNEELHTHLFMSHVRCSDFKQQHTAAMTLFKLVPKNPYYCWAVMSIILQATRGDGASDPTKKSLLLSLAERMIDKLLQGKKLEAEQEVQLYVMVLEAQEKYDKVLETLDWARGAKLTGESVHNKLPYLIKLNRWTEVNLLCKKTLLENINRWDIWKHYLNSVFELNISNNHANHDYGQPDESDTDHVDDTPEKAHEFICKLVETGSENGVLLRGPYLARFELCKHLLEAKDEESIVCLLGDVMELFTEYFRKFGHKPCSVSDLRGYLNLLDTDRRLELAGKLIRDVGITSTNIPQSEEQMQRHICALQLSRLCGAHQALSSEHMKALVTAFAFHYLHGYQTYGQDLLSTDQAPADAYSLLAAHLLYDLHRNTESSQPLLLALVLLKHTLKNSPCNFHVKLLMLRIYHSLGCCLGAQNIYESLDIKHLQLDSMCYIHCARLATTGHYNLAPSLFDATDKFFATNYKDSSDHLTFSYKFGSFLKLTEFMDFRERMRNSFHYINNSVDKAFLSYILCSTHEQLNALDAPTDSFSSSLNWSSIRNNSDISVYVSWDPEAITGPIESWPRTIVALTADQDFLRLRVALVDCMQATLALLVDPTDAQRIEAFQTHVSKWKDLAHTASQKIYEDHDELLCMPLSSRMYRYILAPYKEVLRGMFSLLDGVIVEDVEKCTSGAEIAAREIKVMVQVASGLLRKERECNDVYLCRQRHMEDLSNYIEILSLTNLLTIVCLELIKKKTSGKKNKKKSYDSKIRECVVNLVTTLKEETLMFDEALSKNQEDFHPTSSSNTLLRDLSEKLSALNLGREEEDSVVNMLNKSHSIALKEMRSVVKNKLKLMNVS